MTPGAREELLAIRKKQQKLPQARTWTQFIRAPYGSMRWPGWERELDFIEQAERSERRSAEGSHVIQESSVD